MVCGKLTVANVEMWKVQGCKRGNVGMQKSRHVGMWKCGNVEMFKHGNVEN